LVAEYVKFLILVWTQVWQTCKISLLVQQIRLVMNSTGITFIDSLDWGRLNCRSLFRCLVSPIITTFHFLTLNKVGE